MNKENNIIYFLGIGGIGMSALARYFNHQGYSIYGYDLTPTPLTHQLEKEGMIIHYEENVSLIPDKVDFVVYTPAVPADNQEYQHFLSKQIPIKKRAEVLGEISQRHFTVAVAGTHGKTSISTLIAHLLKQAGIKVTALVGGISKNYRSNFITSEKTDILVLEADEYDRSFLKLHPDIAIVTSVEPDHLDIYGTTKDLENTFVLFSKQLKETGTLIHPGSLRLFDQTARKQITYSTTGKADCKAENITIKNGRYQFDLHFNDQKIREIRMLIPGLHDIENALAASITGFLLGLKADEIKRGLETFSGVERRFDYRIQSPNLIFIDDYAHHPAELTATIQAVKKLYPGKKITGVFQPHLYSRTRDFAKEFAKSLESLDQIVLLDIYPAREKPIEGISSKIILDQIDHPNKTLISKDSLTDYLKKNKPEVLLTLGAGDIGLMLNQIEKAINE